jgi:hypothetical protein
VLAPPCNIELAIAGGFDLPAEQLAHQLHAVTDAEHGHAEAKDLGLHARGIGAQRARGSAGKDHRTRLERADTIERQRAGMDLAVDVLLAHAPGDELRVLRPKVEDQDQIALHVAV